MFNYREMMVKYMAGVIAQEGVSLADYYGWSDDQETEMAAIEQEARTFVANRRQQRLSNG